MLKEFSGRTVHLRPLDDGDLSIRSLWTADEELARLMGVNVEEEPLLSPEDELAGNQEWLAGRRRAGAFVYAIEVEGRYIGDIDVTIVPSERKAELTLFIGDRLQWGKGYGTETVKLVLTELFMHEPVEVVEIDVAPENHRAFRFWERFGFRHRLTDEAGTRWMRLDKPNWKRGLLSELP